MNTALATALSGLAFGLSLIVAIGAQNAYVLRQGLRKEHVLIVVTACAASDAILIAAGVGGLGAVLTHAPWLMPVMRIAGAVFLVAYSIRALVSALRPSGMSTETMGESTTMVAAIGTTLALTWLNPHVYLDTVVLLGSIAATHGDMRWWFALGAVVASLLFFPVLGYGARLLRPFFARAASWRLLDGLVAVSMAAIAVRLVATV